MSKRKSTDKTAPRIELTACFLNCAGTGDEPIEFIVDFHDNLTGDVYVNCYARFAEGLWLGPLLPSEEKNALSYSPLSYLTRHKTKENFLFRDDKGELIQLLHEALACRWALLTERLTRFQAEATDKANMFGAITGYTPYKKTG
jgi:hypothetical protein